jgi:hypothetical protein
LSPSGERADAGSQAARVCEPLDVGSVTVDRDAALLLACGVLIVALLAAWVLAAGRRRA